MTKRQATTHWNKRHPLDRLMDSFIPEPNSGCWIWEAGIFQSGYGTMRAFGKSRYAHKLSWELLVGPVPEGLHALHKCDNRLCINPDHLFIGTIADNNADMHAKGRGLTLVGSRHGSSKLTEDKVGDILADQRHPTDIANHFGVSRSAIEHIKNRRTWQHVALDKSRGGR